ncbi:MAG TPA: 50S ribosomal protein L10 [archaeon]|nr:50S ribosomal protein L10 [archaeon]
MLKSEKPRKVEELAKLLGSYSVIGILNIHKMPTKQMQKIKSKLSGKATIKAAKNIILTKAMEKSGHDLSVLSGKVAGESAIILSNDSPFRLYAALKQNRIASGAKIGDIAPQDITVQKGPTGLPPGPAITTLQKLGLKTTVEAGKIAVSQDKVVAKKGDKITPDMVNGFNLLKLEPMQIGIDMVCAWENGVIYEGKVLDIDKDEYQRNVEACVAAALNLSVNAGYATKDNISIMIQKAFSEARSLVIEADIIDRDFIGDVLAKAAREAKALGANI